MSEFEGANGTPSILHDPSRELTLREQELAAIYERVPGILFYVRIEAGGEFRFLSMSAAGLEATGLTREQLVGAPVRDVIPPPSRELVLNHYRDAIRLGRTVRWKEVSAYPSGQKTGEVAVTPLYDARGVATHLVGVVHDITGREHLEQTLHVREERLAFRLRLNDALRPLRDPVEIQNVTVRLLGEHLGVNRVAYSVVEGDEFIVTTSYEREVAPFRGRRPLSVFGVTLLDAHRRGDPVTCSDVRTDPRLTDAERAQLLAYGIAAFLRVMLRKEGQLVAIFGVNSVTPRDWTRDEVTLVQETAEHMWSAAERVSTEAALREHDQRLRVVLNASAAGSWTRNIGGGGIDWDEGIRQLYGFAPDQPATFEAWLSRVHEEDRPSVLELVDENLQPTCDAWDKTFRIVRPDGTVAWIQSVGRVERDAGGAIRRLAGLELDVTARHEAQSRDLKVLLETATQGILSVDARGTIVMANRALETMFGWQSGELIGQRLERLLPPAFRQIHERHRTNYVSAPRPRLMGGGLHLVGERKDGSTFPIEVSLNQVGGHAFAFVTDITERQQRTLELEHRTAQLSRLASDLTLAEHHAREQIAKTLHDGLQQLLVSATLTLDRRIRRDSQHGAGTDDLLEQVRAHLDQATTIARSLSYELVPPVLRHSGLAAALGWLASWAREKYALEVVVAADPSANTARDDVRTLLFESVRELLFNAVKHAQVNRVMVDLTVNSDEMLCITVRDEGIGFEVARLAEQAGTRQVGWGLFSIRERVSLLGGRFEIESAPGYGTSFRLLVPGDGAQLPGRTVPLELSVGARQEVSVRTGSNPDRPDLLATPSLRILLVDDHAEVINALREILHEHPELRVIGDASNGLEAISRARALRPDVILMDVSMPIMNGVEATRRIHAELPSVQIYGISVDARTQGPHAIEEAGAAGFFVKGADMDRLIDEFIVVHRALNAARGSGRLSAL
jgi:PAS domain S-box-containing protein